MNHCILKRLALVLLVGFCLSIAPQAEAKGNNQKFKVGVMAGWLMLDEVNGLGNAFYLEDVPESGLMLGLRASYPVLSRLWVEAEFGFTPTTLPREQASGEEQGSNDASILSYRLLARYDAWTRDKMSLFASVGVGQMYLSHDKPYVKPGDMDTAFLLGAGFEYQVKHRLSVRLDARWSSSDARPPEAIVDDAGDPTGDTKEYSRSNNIEVLVSAAYAFGGPAKDTDGDGIPDTKDKCPKSPEDKDGFQDNDGCKEIDNDGDQIVDTADRCPNTPEDKDGFRDNDGCPDVDNDEDGIPDTKDKCPNKAEDKDGFRDSDGCPDYDNDGDGVTDKRDRCPKRKEDRDGYKDGDGCPDPDNDGDGFPDAKDKCPNKPENKNGFQDNDGCPDGMPAHIAPLFDGPLKGVKFRRSKLRKRSAKVLEKLLELLLEVQDVQIEIHVHTHTRGRAKRLKRISRKRGKAIVKFFVNAGIDKNRFVVIGHGGEEPVDTGKGRKAKKANERVILKLRPAK